MQTQLKPIQTQQLHKYVLFLAGIWTLFVVTFPLAYLRVSQSDKFAGTPFKSLSLDAQLYSQH